MEPFIGQIMPVGFNFAPRGWALCDGQIMPIAQNTALFSLLGTTFGGDGRTTYALPDLRGRNIRHVGNGPGLDDVRWGEKGGRNNITLTTQNLPSHTHSGQIAYGGAASGPAGAGKFLSANTGGTNIYADAVTPARSGNGAVETNATGGGQSFNSLNPFLGIFVCIALTGIYPSRS